MKNTFYSILSNFIVKLEIVLETIVARLLKVLYFNEYFYFDSLIHSVNQLVSLSCNHFFSLKSQHFNREEYFLS